MIILKERKVLIMINNREKYKNISMNDLANLVNNKKKQNAIEKLPRDKNVFPQSYSQSSQWFMQQLATDCIYNVPQAYRMKGTLHISRLEAAINKIIERHEIMRTVFNAVDNVPSQIIRPYEPFSLQVIDLTGYIGKEQEQMVQRENENLVRMPFNLSVGPLYRFVLLKLSEEEFMLTYTLHHIISDGWSFGVIIKELNELYQRDLDGRGPLEPLKLQYADYAVWQRKQMDSGKMKQQLSYWMEQLKGINDCINLPADAPRYNNQTHKGDNCYMTISKETFEAISRLCVKEHTTSYHLLLSIFFILLHKYSGDKDICIGTPVANRSRVELEELIGLFINTVVIRSQIEKNKKFMEFVQGIKNTSINAFENGEVPFEKVVENLNTLRNNSFSPVFQVLYVQMETSQIAKQVKLSDLEISSIPVSTGSAQFDLSMYVTVDNVDINVSMEYNTDLFLKETVLQMMSDFEALLNCILKEPDKEISYYLNAISAKRFTMAVSSTFEAEPVSEAMNLWIKKLAMPCDLVFTPYSQVFQQIVFEDSAIRKNQEGINIILLRLEDWIQGIHEDFEKIKGKLIQNTEEFIQAVNEAKLPSLSIYLCPHSPKVAALGKLALLITGLEQRIKEECSGASVYFAAKAASLYSLTNYQDESGDREWHIPYSREFFAVLGTYIMSNVFKKSIQSAQTVYLVDAASMLKDAAGRQEYFKTEFWDKMDNHRNIVVVRGNESDIPSSCIPLVNSFMETASVVEAAKRCKETYEINGDEIIVFTNSKAISEEEMDSFICINTENERLNTAFLL
jgi:hypothetical protein